MPLFTHDAEPRGTTLRLSPKERVQRVKARLYPLTPFAGFLEFLVERLPRRCVEVHLEPAEDLASLGQGEYRSTGKNPTFTIAPTPPIAAGGWFYLEAALVRHTGDREAMIHGIGPAPACEAFHCPIPSNLRGTIREVVFIPSKAQRVCWSPMREPGFFSQSELLVHRITAMESWLRRAHRVLLTWLEQRRSPARSSLHPAKALGNLQQAYLQTARMQIERYRGHDYAGFLARLDKPIQRELSEIASRLEGSRDTLPRLSVLLHVGLQVRQDLLQQAIGSLRAQRYREWEAIVVIDGGTTSSAYAWLAAQSHADERIHLIPGEQALDGARWFRTAFTAANGQFIGVLGAHDLLAPHALLFLADALARKPETTVVYADHDSIHPDGRRHDPCFKPDWNPDGLAAHNYIGEPCFYAAGLVRRLGGYRAEADPAHAYDLLLRSCFSVEASTIVHVPRILYHRRTLPATSPVPETLHDAGRRVLEFVLGGTGASIHHGLVRGTYHVRHPLPSPAPLVSIIVPTRDKLPVLRACVESLIAKTGYGNWELLIVDNASRQAETLAWLSDVESDPRIRVLRDPRPFNYSTLNNAAVHEADGEVVVLLNNDVEIIDSAWLEELVAHALRPGIGAVGAKLLYPNGMVQHAGVVLGIGGVAGHVHRYLGGEDPGYMLRAVVTQNFSVVTAACLAVRRSLYLEMGGLDEKDLRVAFNDVDFCLKLVRAGYRNVYTPFARLIHHESLSRGHDDTPEKKAVFKHEFGLMKQRLGGFVDPAYNPNLSLEFEDFSLRRN